MPYPWLKLFTRSKGALAMARTVSWRHRADAIARRVSNYVTETWTRVDLERAFEVRRATAQSLMKAIGEIANVGGTYVVPRSAILRYLEEVSDAPDLTAAHRERVQLAEPVPRPRSIRLTLPEDLRSVMMRDLPADVSLTPGKLEIRGETSYAIFEHLYLLLLAMENDLGSVQDSLELPSLPPPVEDDEIRAMFQALREEEARVQRAPAP